jgi:hypothetical protein
MSLLTIVQASFDEIGFPRPSSVVGNTDQLARQSLALLNRTGKELARERDWTVLQREHSFSTAAGTAEYVLPTDFDHFINDTAWDQGVRDPMRGPVPPQEWQSIKSGLFGTGVNYRRWRLKRGASVLANRFTLDPTPTAIAPVVFEYISTYWCTDILGTTGRAAMSDDTDLPLLPEHLMVMGLSWRLLKAKGLEYGDSLAEYRAALEREMGRDGGAPKLSLSGRRFGPSLIGRDNIPETGYGV